MKTDTIKLLAIMIVTAAIVRSLISIESLLRMLMWQLHTLQLIEQVNKMTYEMKKFGISVMAVLFVLALAVPALALSASAASANPYDQQILQARYDLVSANIGFMTGVMSDTVSLVPQASNLQAPADKLNGDLSTLQGYVSSSDNTGFSNYVKNTITPDVKSAQDVIKSDRQQFKSWNVTNATRQQLKTDYQNRKATYESQVSNANVELGKIRLQSYNDVMAKDDTVIANMSAKGMDVSGMQAVENNAKSNVIAPLQSAVNSNDGKTVRDELKAKSLGNGAPYSDHFYANSDLQRLKSVSAKIGASTNNSTVQQQLADVNSKLSSVSGTLSSIGTSPYSGDQQNQVWNTLKSAADELRAILNQHKGSQNKQG